MTVGDWMDKILVKFGELCISKVLSTEYYLLLKYVKLLRSRHHFLKLYSPMFFLSYVQYIKKSTLSIGQSIVTSAV